MSQGGFVNDCHARMPSGGFVTFEDFAAYFEPRLPAGLWDVHHYLGATTRAVLVDDPMASRATYRDLLARGWNDARAKFAPANLACFAFAGERLPGHRWGVEVDDKDMPILVFDPTAPFTGYFTESW